jgi:FtsH-binding integral membrane protein
VSVGELAWPVRVVFSVALLVSLAAAELVSDAFYWPLAVVAGFLFVVLPVVVRLFGRERKEPIPRASGRVVIIFAAVLTLLAVTEVALVPDFGLGATFWIAAILVPSIEVLGYLTRREARASTLSQHDPER